MDVQHLGIQSYYRNICDIRVIMYHMETKEWRFSAVYKACMYRKDHD